jgi:hypothetical protein
MARLKFINALPHLVGNERGPQEAILLDDAVFTTDTDASGNVTITLTNTFDPTFDDLTADAITAASVTAGKVVMTPGAELTIAAGVVTATSNVHVVDTEADAASDDLDTISGTAAGQMLVISAADSARTVVAKDGTGNLKLVGDFSMDNVEDRLFLISDGTNLYELGRNDVGA